MRDEIASWFDSAMHRVSGTYKRRTQAFVFRRHRDSDESAVTSEYSVQPPIPQRVFGGPLT